MVASTSFVAPLNPPVIEPSAFTVPALRAGERFVNFTSATPHWKLAPRRRLSTTSAPMPSVGVRKSALPLISKYRDDAVTSSGQFALPEAAGPSTANPRPTRGL